MVMLKATGLIKQYDAFTLDNIDIELQEGELFGCLGPNGSGKTTLVKILTGQTVSNKGSIHILGTNVIKDPVKAKSKIGIIPEQESPPSFLTVQEYLEFICKVRNIDKINIEKWLDFFDYKAERHNLIKDLSRGTKQKVVATQAFIHEPKLVFIDEPLINLDPIIQHKFKEYLKNYAKKGNTIFLSTHVLSIADEICTRIGILRKGKLIFQGSMQDIRKQKKNLEDYFVTIVNTEENKKTKEKKLNN